MKLNRRHSYLRASNEEAPGKRRTNWGKYVYLAFIAAILISSAGVFISRYLRIEGEGQVVFNKLSIQHTDDIRILKIQVKEGQTVNKGDALFTYAERKTGDNGNAAAPVAADTTDIDREIARAQQAIAAKRIEQKAVETELEYQRADYKYIREQIILETYLPDRLNETAAKIRNLELDLKKADAEAAVMNEYIANLHRIRSQKAKAVMAHSARRKTESETLVFYAMQNGVITGIFNSDYEVALKGQTIMEIHNPENVMIKAFFEQEYLDAVQSGATVLIKFPDGAKSRGRIERSYFATVPLPPEIQKRFEPVKRNIVADIVPYSPEERQKWKAFYKMNVRILISELNDFTTRSTLIY